MSKLVGLDHVKLVTQKIREALGGQISEVAKTAADALTEMGKAKQDKQNAVSVALKTTGWAKDSTAAYPQYYDISVTGLTAMDRVDVVIAPGSMVEAIRCGLCPSSETLAGKIRIRAAEVPGSTMQAAYWIEKGKEQ